MKVATKQTQLDKATGIYKQWINYWPKEEKEAIEIAYSFLLTAKERVQFDQWLNENRKS